jgi:iron(III) transport system substrate-binding protein
MTKVTRRLAFAVLGVALWAGSATAEDESAEWNKLVAAAEQEGTVVINSQPNQAWRDYILREFPKAYPKITVNLSVIPTEQFVARVRIERQADKYLWDLVASGATSGFALQKDNALDLFLPELVLPEVKDEAVWGGWDEALVDSGRKYVFAMSAYLQPPYYNAKVVPPALVERLGLKAMLQPEYVGKTAWHDPTLAGGGQAIGPLIRAALGDDGLKKLIVDQKAVFYPQQQSVVEAMARGTALFALGPPVQSLIAPYVQAGATTGIEIRSFGNSPDAAYLSIGGNCLYVFSRRPHPNAARVFINWMLTKQVQYDIAKALDMASRRQDIPPTMAPEAMPIRGAKYITPQREESFPELVAVGKLVEDLRKSAP